MKHISAKTLLIIGLIVTFGSPIFIEIVALAYPNMPERIGMPLVFSFYFSGTILFVLSLAKSRMEKGKIKADNVIKAMTPAQICLISSMIILFIGVLLGELINETVGSFFGALGFIGVLSSIILAISRAIKHVRAWKKTYLSQNKTKIPYHPKESCARCGSVADEGTYKKINGYKLCDSCAEIMEESKEADILKINAKCCVCKKEIQKTKMVFVDDQYICDNCFQKRYTRLTPITGNTEDL